MTANNDLEDSEIPSGYTILGQFITHDLTLNTTPLNSPLINQNFRTPALDLDSVYAKSRETNLCPPRDLPDNPAMMKIGRVQSGNDLLDDLPRFEAGNSAGQPEYTAQIGDLRNDENVLISQLHLAFLKLHNRFVKDLQDEGVPDAKLFDKAKQRCQWYFQWVVVNDYLPRIVGKKMVEDILGTEKKPPLNLKLYHPGAAVAPPTMPHEFAAAAFRFGHSMIRPRYHVDVGGGSVTLFGDTTTGTSGLAGTRPINGNVLVDWPRFFFELPPTRPIPQGSTHLRNLAQKINSHLPAFLGDLPKPILPTGDTSGVTSLALRDLERSVNLGMQSGQEIAKAVAAAEVDGVTVLTNEQLGQPATAWPDGLPLWFYLLKEAEVTKNAEGKLGEQLGPVGGRIVAEVILGLLQHDASSYLHAPEPFTPTIKGGPADGNTFRMADILRLAGVTPPEQ
jgi:hypothetical protein